MPHQYPREESRFQFGKNWRNFLKHFSEERLVAAELSLQEMLGSRLLCGKTFLDMGSGSGLFSLAAYRLGAEVVSFDYDLNSVAATQTLRNRYALPERSWRVEHGSVLDQEYLALLGAFDVVYSWGVLHHTGKQWEALANAAASVRSGGLLYIALYNDQGLLSKFWKLVKMLYNRYAVGRCLLTLIFLPPISFFQMARSLIMTGNPLWHYIHHKERGMSPFHDIIDWIGGFPFEVSSPEEVLNFLRPHGLILERIRTTNGHGNNEFLFRKPSTTGNEAVARSSFGKGSHFTADYGNTFIG